MNKVIAWLLTIAMLVFSFSACSEGLDFEIEITNDLLRSIEVIDESYASTPSPTPEVEITSTPEIELEDFPENDKTIIKENKTIFIPAENEGIDKVLATAADEISANIQNVTGNPLDEQQKSALKGFLDNLSKTEDFAIYTDTLKENEGAHVDGNVATNELEGNLIFNPNNVADEGFSYIGDGGNIDTNGKGTSEGNGRDNTVVGSIVVGSGVNASDENGDGKFDSANWDADLFVIPEEIKDDPEALEDWLRSNGVDVKEGSLNIKETLDNLSSYGQDLIDEMIGDDGYSTVDAMKALRTISDRMDELQEDDIVVANITPEIFSNNFWYSQDYADETGDYSFNFDQILSNLINGNVNNATIVINIVVTEENQDQMIQLYKAINAELHSEHASYVVWNFGDYGGEIEIDQAFAGVLVAPNADVIIKNTVQAGRIVANSVEHTLQGGGVNEVHGGHGGPRYPEDKNTPMPEVTPTIKPSPTPTEEPTATPTPEVTITPEPEIEETPTPVITPTPTIEATPTLTVTPSPSPTNSPTPTPTIEVTPTPTPTNSPSPTPTVEITPSPSPTVEITPSPTPTTVPTPTPTIEPTPKVSIGPSPSTLPDSTLVETPTPSPTPTIEVTPSPTPTDSPSPIPTVTVSPSPTPTVTASPTPTATVTNSPSPTPTVEVTPSPSPTATVEVTPTPTVEPTPTATIEVTPTPTVEPTPTATVEITPTPTIEITPTPEPTEEPTPTPTVEITPAPTPEITITPTPTVTVEITPTPTVSATPEVTPSPTPVVTNTPEPTEEITPTPEVTNTPAPAPTVEPTPEVTNTPEITPTVEPTITPTVEPTPEVTSTPIVTPESTPEITNTPEPTPTIEVTSTPEPTEEVTPTPEITAEPTPTAIPTTEPTSTPEVTETPTVEPTPVVTETPEVTDAPEPTITPTETPAATNTPTVTEEPTIAPTETPVITEEPESTPTATVEVTPTITPTEEPVVTPTPTIEVPAEPTNTPAPQIPVITPVPTVTATLTPTDTPEPTPEPTPIPETRVSGSKSWNDNNNEGGTRPSSITIRLHRNGEVIATTTASAASGWSYSFGSLPAVDENGNPYSYSISESMVSGYYSTVNGYNLVNTLISGAPTVEDYDPDNPDIPNGGRIVTRPDGTIQIVSYGTPLGFAIAGQSMESELEDYIDLFGYGTPLWGGLLATGDNTPLYPFIFLTIGLMALFALFITKRKAII